jgi:uncharacterized protein
VTPGVKQTGGSGEPDRWIRRLGLTPHPEGGYFREIYRSDETLAGEALPGRYGGGRPFSTSIYFLLKSGQPSRFHRLRSDEVWHFYEGGPLRIHILKKDGRYEAMDLGRDPGAGLAFQAIVPRGSWFGAEVIGPDSFSLIGCTIAPGFDYADFALARRRDLLKRFPRRRALIERLTIP